MKTISFDLLHLNLKREQNYQPEFLTLPEMIFHNYNKICMVKYKIFKSKITHELVLKKRSINTRRK